MEAQIVAGKEVTLRSALGPIRRRVVEIHGDVVAVCSQKEYRKATGERRKPSLVGFKLSDVVAGEAE